MENNCVAIISNSDSLREVKPVNLQSQFRNIETKTFVDSGSVCIIISKSLADAVIMNSKSSYGTKQSAIQDLKTFYNELIKTVGLINTTVKCKDWIATKANVTVAENEHRPNLGRDLFPQPGLSLTKSKQV